MNNLNSLILEGDISNIQFSEVQSRNICKFNIAVHSFSSKEETTSHFDCECYATLAERVKRNIKDGSKIRLVGKLAQTTYQYKDNVLSKIFVIAEHIEVPKLAKVML